MTFNSIEFEFVSINVCLCVYVCVCVCLGKGFGDCFLSPHPFIRPLFELRIYRPNLTKCYSHHFNLLSQICRSGFLIGLLYRLYIPFVFHIQFNSSICGNLVHRTCTISYANHLRYQICSHMIAESNMCFSFFDFFD